MVDYFPSLYTFVVVTFFLRVLATLPINVRQTWRHWWRSKQPEPSSNKPNQMGRTACVLRSDSHIPSVSESASNDSTEKQIAVYWEFQESRANQFSSDMAKCLHTALWSARLMLVSLWMRLGCKSPWKFIHDYRLSVTDFTPIDVILKLVSLSWQKLKNIWFHVCTKTMNNQTVSVFLCDQDATVLPVKVS